MIYEPSVTYEPQFPLEEAIEAYKVACDLSGARFFQPDDSSTWDELPHFGGVERNGWWHLNDVDGPVATVFYAETEGGEDDETLFHVSPFRPFPPRWGCVAVPIWLVRELTSDERELIEQQRLTEFEQFVTKWFGFPCGAFPEAWADHYVLLATDQPEKHNLAGAVDYLSVW